MELKAPRDRYQNFTIISWLFLMIQNILKLNLCSETDISKTAWITTWTNRYFYVVVSIKKYQDHEEFISSVITQKGKSQNGGFKKESTPNFPKSEHLLPPDTHTYVFLSGDKKCSLFGKFGVLCFLETHILWFVFLAYHRQNYKRQSSFRGWTKR